MSWLLTAAAAAAAASLLTKTGVADEGSRDVSDGQLCVQKVNGLVHCLDGWWLGRCLDFRN